MNDLLLQTAVGKDCFEVPIELPYSLIDYRNVAYDLGYGKKGIPEPFLSMVKEIDDHVSEECNVRAGYRVLDINRSENRSDGFSIGKNFLSLQKIITFQLRKAQKAALFTCTIGDAMETRATRLFREGDPLKGHLTDTIASAAVERVADLLHDHIGSMMAKMGLGITNRFSPGYCGWPVTDQYAIFSFFPEKFCGITVTDSALMLPKKSISGIIGIGAEVNREPYFCDRCKRKDCSYRAYRQAREKNNVD
jgi:hypothetical protein